MVHALTAALTAALGALGVAFMRVLARLPLRWVRGLGWTLGWLLYGLAWSRRRVVKANLLLCFSEQTNAVDVGQSAKIFSFFAKAWLDRGWLWHGSPQEVHSRLKLEGAVHELRGNSEPVVIFAPHFYGLDAAWTALTLGIDRRFVTIYATQSNAAVDDWILQGRQRFGAPLVMRRGDGPSVVAAAIRRGEPLYLLPDMDYGTNGAVFAPFFGVQAATVTSLSRFAKLGRAKVVPVTSRMTASGYTVTVHPAWANYPTGDVQRDAERMNLELQAWVLEQPFEYYWVHKRFKTRPPGEASPYG